MPHMDDGPAPTPRPQPWPRVTWQRRDWLWDPEGPRPRRAEVDFCEFDAAVPPAIAGRAVVPGPEASAVLESAHAAIDVLDRATTVDLTALAGALLRSESVASSKIENLRTSQRDLGLALIGPRATLHGLPVRTAAAQVAANVQAMQVATQTTSGGLDLDDVLGIHRTLLDDGVGATDDAAWAGHLRTMQNWIGGSDRSPQGALFVPPPPGLVGPLMHDLIAFCNRDDLDPLAQAAVAHAQFETIHPFTDGNGRTGRALVHVLLRRRALVTRTVLPVSTVLLADVDGYFAGLDDYRQGRLDRWLARFAAAASMAASAGLRLAGELAETRGQWWRAVQPRRGSAVAAVLEQLLLQPVVDITRLRTITGEVADKNLYRAVDRLVAAGVLSEISGAGRNRVWAALDVLDLLEQFEGDLGRRRAAAR